MNSRPVYCSRLYGICNSHKTIDFQNKSHILEKLNSFQHFANNLTDPAIRTFRTDLTCAYILIKNQESVRFVCVESNFLKEICSSGYGQQLFVFNPLLDSSCNFGFKNIGLLPGVKFE